MCELPVTPEPTPIAAGGAKPNAGAETVLGLYHKVAAGASGAFVLAHIVPATTKEAGKRPLHVQRFRINDAEGMAAEARSRGACENVYFGPALMRTDLAKRKRGEEGDITAVLAIVLEEDGDTGKLVIPPCGIAPTFEIETSHAPTLNRHFHFVFDQPLTPQDAKALALLAHRKCGGDSGGKDICHVWRVPETLNFPDWRKLARGRPETPQPIRLIGGTGEPINVDRFRAALEAMPDPYPELKAGESTDWRAGGSKDRAAIIERLKPRLISKMEGEGKDRSTHCFSVLMSLFDANLTDDEVLIVATGAPFARKFDERGDLEEEISRSRARWNAQKQHSDGQEGDAASGDEKKTQAQKLIELADDIEFFHTPEGVAYAHVQERGQRRTIAVKERAFKLLLLGRFYRATGGAPNDEALRTAISTLEARALFDGEEVPVFLRTAEHRGKIYINLARDDGSVVEIDASGWRVRQDAPVRFRRPPGMLPMPEPQGGGSIIGLTSLLNLSAKSDFVLIVCWLLGALYPRGPYPIAGIRGEQGSAKSTATWILRMMADPNQVPLRSLPREERDLAISAKNSHVLCFDNLSGLPTFLSDALCKVATGGGFSTRELYTDDGEKLFSDRRPQIMNGIDDFATRGDLAERCLMFRLVTIDENRRRTEAAVHANFAREHPKLLGALFDTMAHGLRELSSTKLDKLPRMADFALWAVACEGAFKGLALPWKDVTGRPEQWEPGDFIRAYTDNRVEIVGTVLDADPVAAALLTYMEVRTSWTGTATDLQNALVTATTDTVRRGKDWPGSAQTLSNRLTRLTPDLRRVGITITRFRLPGGKARMITIEDSDGHPLGEDRDSASQPSQHQKPSDFNRLDVTATHKFAVTETVTEHKANGKLNGHSVNGDDVCDDARDAIVTDGVTAKSLKSKACDERDACDGIFLDPNAREGNFLPDPTNGSSHVNGVLSESGSPFAPAKKAFRL